MLEDSAYYYIHDIMGFTNVFIVDFTGHKKT